jgi:carbonic anhydrase
MKGGGIGCRSFRGFLPEVRTTHPFGCSRLDLAESCKELARRKRMDETRRPRMSVRQEVLAANAGYAASFGEKGKLTIPPARHFTILTCMDARLDPAKYAGLSEGDAHVIRNAGGRASDDALRSLVISYKLLGTNEFFVIHHTDCGMLFFTDELMRTLLASSLETAQLTPTGFRDVGKGPGSTEGEFIDWLTMKDNAAGSSLT